MFKPTKENMLTVANNIADVIINFDKDYKQFEDQTLDDYMNEFMVAWLDGSDEYAVIFGDELIFDGFENEHDAQKVYDELTNLSYEIANRINGI